MTAAGIGSRNLTSRAFSFVDRASLDIFDTCPSVSNPQVIYAVSRNGYFQQHDVREGFKGNGYWRLSTSPLAYVRSIDEYRLLTAGAANMMAVYDMRWPFKRGRDPFHAGPSEDVVEKLALPYVKFPEYRNNAHSNLGIDVDLDSGVVAAAHDNGEVGIYSLRSGVQLDCKPAKVQGAPVRCLQFHTVPGRGFADLFVGDTKATVTRFSVGGRRSGDDEVG
jgi:hypothetical protein